MIQELNNFYLPAETLPHLIVPFPVEITVHLGVPDDPTALNVTVPYIDYIKNVGSSELYPTWPEEAIRANLLAISSVAMNRIFTEWYRSRGYDFDITNSTAFDQAYVHGRGIFDTISNIANETFNQYIVRNGFIEPLFATFCDGRVAQCNGLFQWGTVDLANQGYSALDILKYYYGDDIRIEQSVSPGIIIGTYPGRPLTIGDSGITVFRMQHSLNRISDNYPGIPKIEITGYFDEQTANAVRVFQQVFNLPVTGIVDEETWYLIRRIWVSVTQLGELTSEGLIFADLIDLYSSIILEGGNRPIVVLIQYFINLLSAFYDTIPTIEIDGYYGPVTTEAIKAFQLTMGLPPSGIVDQNTWNELYRNAYGILSTIPIENIYLPKINFLGLEYSEGMGLYYPGVFILEIMLSYISKYFPEIPSILAEGIFDEDTRNAVIAFQTMNDLNPTGIVDENTWNAIVNTYQTLRNNAVA